MRKHKKPWLNCSSEPLLDGGFRRGSGQQIHELLVKLFGIEINLHFDRLYLDRRLNLLRPSQDIAVTSAAVEVDIHVTNLFFGDNAGFEPGSSCQFIPQIVVLA